MHPDRRSCRRSRSPRREAILAIASAAPKQTGHTRQYLLVHRAQSHIAVRTLPSRNLVSATGYAGGLTFGSSRPSLRSLWRRMLAPLCLLRLGGFVRNRDRCVTIACGRSQVDVEPEHLHEDRSAITVVARMIDVLQTPGRRDSAPVVRRVVRFEDVLAAVAQRPVSQQKAQTPERQVLAVRRGQTV